MKSYNYLIFSILCFCISCGPKYYAPNIQNVPLLKERGDAQISGSISEYSYEIQSATAITNNFAAQFNLASFHNSNTSEDETSTVTQNGKYAEFGAGYYNGGLTPIIFESYLLGGLGSSNNIYTDQNVMSDTRGNLDSKFSKLSFQQNLGIKYKYFEFALSGRISRVDLFNYSGNLIYQNIDQVNYLDVNNGFFIVEPALTLRVGLEEAKMQIQFQRSHNLTNSRFNQHESSISIGLQFPFYTNSTF